MIFTGRKKELLLWYSVNFVQWNIFFVFILNVSFKVKGCYVQLSVKTFKNLRTGKQYLLLNLKISGKTAVSNHGTVRRSGQTNLLLTKTKKVERMIIKLIEDSYFNGMVWLKWIGRLGGKWRKQIWTILFRIFAIKRVGIMFWRLAE